MEQFNAFVIVFKFPFFSNLEKVLCMLEINLFPALTINFLSKRQDLKSAVPSRKLIESIKPAIKRYKNNSNAFQITLFA